MILDEFSCNRKIEVYKYFILFFLCICLHINTSNAQTRLGLHYTKEELAIWKIRSRNSPYKKDGDISLNSPGDYTRILSNANSFLINPSQERFIGYSGTGCVPKSVDYEPNSKGVYIKDAAFAFLITEESKYAVAVKNELLAQAKEPTTDFSNSSRWCPNYIDDMPPGYATASWMTRLLFSYDYIKSTVSSTEKQLLDTWFLNAAKYFQSQVDPALEKLYANRYQGNYTLTDYAVRSTGPSASTSHYGGYQISGLAKYYNNRRGDMVRFYAMVGIMQQNSSLKTSSKLYIKEWLKYSTYPNGIIGEFERWATDLPDKGLSYAAAVVSQAIEIADAFARTGDEELYKYTTSEGLYGTAGGAKNILLTIKNILSYFDGTVTRYGTSDPAKVGNVAYLIDGKNDATSWYAAFDTYMAKANVYYQDTYIRNAYTRKGANTKTYPVKPAGAGPFSCWTGPGGIYPGMLLMFGGMEGKTWPYVSIPAANRWVANKLPTISITAPINGANVVIGSDIEISVTALDVDGTIGKVEFFHGSTKIGEDLTAPFSFTWQNVPVGTYSIMTKATDDQGGVTTSDKISISTSGTCTTTGTILREYWNKVGGSSIASIPVTLTPSGSQQLSILEAPKDFGENFASRIRGYVCAPATGSYTFWIASDGYSELWLSTTGAPSAKTKIAYVYGETKLQEWTKYSSQQSQTIHLIAGQKCYIEVLHKEVSGNDHVAVGWQLPDGTLERPIPGNRLSTFDPAANTIKPTVEITFPVNNTNYIVDAPIIVNVEATDSDGSIEKVVFYQNDIKLGEDFTAPYSLTINNNSQGTYNLIAKSYDNSGAISTTDITTISVNTMCSSVGTILREYWAKMPLNSTISSIPINSVPTTSSQLSSFEGPSDFADNYASRIRGYVCPPVTGNYIFWIASDGSSELWLSSDDSPMKKAKIAYVNGFTYSKEYNKYASQQSVLIKLLAGQKYYIEALHIEGGGSDHLSIAWQMPDGTVEKPISGKRLSPYIAGVPFVNITNPNDQSKFTEGTSVTLEANAYDINGNIMKVEFYEGSTKIGEDLTSPYRLAWNKSIAGSYFITAKAIDNSGASSFSAVNTIVITPGLSCSGTGGITREYWPDVAGKTINDIPLSSTNKIVSQLSLFEAPRNVGYSYGSRIRGYVCPPVSGNYIFWISGDDNCALFLSSNESASNKTQIAYISGVESGTGFSSYKEWNKYSSQQSSPIALQAGQRYYIEALHKQGAGGDHIEVGWQVPDPTGPTLERPIPGKRLIPFEVLGSSARVSSNATPQKESSIPNTVLNAYPNPFTEKLTIEFNVGVQSNATLDIYTMTGVLVKRLYDGNAKAHYNYTQEITNTLVNKAGLYILRLCTDGEILYKKVLLEK